MVEAAEAKYEQEIRFAVVLYGGVSLAIYINGIAQELLRMVRGTAKLPDGEGLKGTELIYRELGQIIGLDGPRKDLTPDPEDTKTYPIRSRFVVDIISGASAGGINGVALAKALALKCRDLNALKNTWLEEAQLDLLLNDKKSDRRKYPVGSKTTSLLNSERMYGKILETLLAMNDPTKCTADAADFADNLDLFVTATDLAGLETRIQLTGHTIKERVHRAVFHFEYPPVCPENEQSENQFDREHDPMLAFAARCTSSFPAAFEPVRFDHIKNQVEKHELNVEETRNRLKDFFPAYGSDFSRRQFADGGYLDNRPFSYVSDLIQYRSATRPTKRKLLFVDPFPELQGRDSDVEREISFVENALLAAVSLPRYEVIRGDIQTIITYNRRLERLNALKKRVEEDRGALKCDSTTLPESPKNFSELDLKAMVVDKRYGHLYPPYHHLRVYDTTDALARMITRLGRYEPDSDQFWFLRRVLRAWRDARYHAYPKQKPENAKKKTENAFLDEFDVDYRLRRLNHIRVLIDKKIIEDRKSDREQKNGKEDSLSREEKVKLAGIRRSTEKQLKYLRDKADLLSSPKHSQLVKDEKSGSLIADLRKRLELRFDRVMNVPDYEKRVQAAESVYRELHSDIDAVMEAIRLYLKGVFEKNSKEMNAILPLRMEGKTPAIEDVWQAYHSFHWEDFLSLPLLEGSGAKEYAEVEIYRVSPADSELKPIYVKEGGAKLVGTAVGAFGGFLQKEWREHDMMWGRLDGAERIIMALLPEPTDDDSDNKDNRRKRNKLREKFITRAQDIILKEEFSLAEPGSKDRIFYWLAHKLRDRDVTDASVADLIARGKELLETTFPGLSDVVREKDFRTFLLSHYCAPPPPDPDRIADWSARSFKILGQMIDDLPDDRLVGIRGRLSGASRSTGVLLTNMLTFATPGSIGRKVSGHWLILIALAALLLIAVGPFVGLSEAGLIGAIVIAACLSLWAFSQSFGKWVKGRRGFHPFLTLAALIVMGLVVLGAIDFWNTAKELAWSDVRSGVGWAWERLSDYWASNLLFHSAAMAIVVILAFLGLIKLWELRPDRYISSSFRRLKQAHRRIGPAKRTARDAG